MRQSSQGNIYGLTYVDFRSKCVFNGSDLGRECSAKGILEQLRQEQKREGLKLSQEKTNREGQGNIVTLRQELKQGQEHNHDLAKKQETENR